MFYLILDIKSCSINKAFLSQVSILMNNYTYPYPRPSLTADIVPLRFYKNQLQVLLIERAKDPFAGKFALPGGFADENENILNTAKRELEEETMVKDPILSEIGSYSNPGRDPRGWTVTVAFIAFLPEDTQALAGDDAQRVQWFPIDQLPELAFDHQQILNDAKEKLKNLSLTSTLPLLLLPKAFRHRHVRFLYNQIWQKSFQPRAIKAWTMKLGLFQKSSGPGKYEIAKQIQLDQLID
jgi:8-oxo-dGTP diphosphatase